MGDYKSAAEMLTRTGPSQPAEENIELAARQPVRLARGHDRPVARQDGRAGPRPDRSRSVHGRAGPGEGSDRRGRDAGGVPRDRRERSGRPGARRQPLRPGGEGQDQPGQSAGVLLPSVRDVQAADGATSQKDAVAVIYVEGAILPGYSQPTLFGAYEAAFSGDIRKALETAAEDDSVKAVVMRVDSPGGSAEASEVILNAARRVKAKKPLIVSMGNVAGSGGYYVSCGADAIFADEATITASIGVVGGKLVTTDLWNKLGVNWVGHKRGANADLLSSARPFDDAQRKVIQDYMQQVYEVFKGHVTQGPGRQAPQAHRRDRRRPGLYRQAGPGPGPGGPDRRPAAGGRIRRRQGVAQGLRDPRHPGAEGLLHAADRETSPAKASVRRTSDCRASTSLLAGHPTLAPLLDLLQKTEPAACPRPRPGPAANRADPPRKRDPDDAVRHGPSMSRRGCSVRV